MAKRPLTQLKDAVVLAYLRSVEARRHRLTGQTCGEIKAAINHGYRALLHHEEVYNALLRLEADGEVERRTENARVVQWRATRSDSVPVREPERTLSWPSSG